MKTTILKYPIWEPEGAYPGFTELPPKGPHHIEIPALSTFRHIGEQYDGIYVWYEVPLEKTILDDDVKEFEIFKTGEEIVPEKGLTREFVATVQLESGYVYHIFERNY